MNHFNTLRVRFALATAGLMLAVLVLFGGIVYFWLRQGLTQATDDSLRMSASQAVAAVNIDDDGKLDFEDVLPTGPVGADLQGRGLTIRIFSLQGRMIHSAGPFQDVQGDTSALRLAALGTPVYSTLAAKNGEPLRAFTTPILIQRQQIGSIQVIRSLAPERQTLAQLLMILSVSIPVLLIVSALSGYFLAANALEPVDQITYTAQRISAEDLSARLNLPRTGDEVSRLAATFDQMLERLEDAFQRERQFTADASHELRTPLAATQTIISVTRERPRSTDEYIRALDDIAEETGRLSAVTENLLQIARGETGLASAFEIVDLSELLDDVAGSLKPVAEARGLGLQWEITPGLSLPGDRDALIRLFVNLIDNAIKYTDRGSVLLHAAPAPRRGIEITLTDTGRGIPQEHLPHIFERFYRVEVSRTTTGAGLGLSIVQGIVQAHRGTIDVTSQVGVGSCFRILFPLGITQ